ncbi:uncharacterized protein CLAFUR5_06112 [Fulvia fulva]|uniref:Uncharacterized protein n=1 Tax=Passalora fulva TaxID=5499 RepID=A0A9Q8P9L2_PASFU|nr:uncharacterized protein CLAFUR5_06112 [Fulvia fulva]KAK4625907.1 hypothetical protein CLAFUR0_05975 [Fulvia fulva]UJO18061.1 hypothetical protein CLAFUR5_06112 [Fulvia fulva]
MLFSEGMPSPHDGSTPLIEHNSDILDSSIRSTPCPRERRRTSPAHSESTLLQPSSNRATPGGLDVFEPPKDEARDHGAAAGTQEQLRLQESIASLRRKLEASTALVDRFHLRNEVIRLEKELNEKKLEQARSEQQSAKEDASTAVEAGRKKEVALSSILCILLLALFVYVNWSLFYSPEISYVRQRRRTNEPGRDECSMGED